MSSFEPLSARSRKIRCTECGRTGYPYGRWMDTCRRGHAPMTCCGKTSSLLLNGKPRSHSRKPIGCVDKNG